jgi:hypothetical protein
VKALIALSVPSGNIAAAVDGHLTLDSATLDCTCPTFRPFWTTLFRAEKMVDTAMLNESGGMTLPFW